MHTLTRDRSARTFRLTSLLAVLTAALVFALSSRPDAATTMMPPSAPPLPAPSGTTVSVATVAELQAAVSNLVSGTTILIQPGTYRLTQQLRINRAVTNVALRGATNNRADVVILGGGMATRGVDIAIKVEDAQDVLLANFSVGQTY
jgi:pectin methylesterase-like acyl-CoA thioesterase